VVADPGRTEDAGAARTPPGGWLDEARAAFSGAADQSYQEMKALLGKL